jgi:hypothetical protein
MDNVTCNRLFRWALSIRISVEEFYRGFSKNISVALFSTSAIIRANRESAGYWIRLSLTNILDHDGKSIRIIGFESDITRES